MTLSVSPDRALSATMNAEQLDSPWGHAQKAVAVVGVVLVAMRFELTRELTAGDLVALFLVPVWFPVTLYYSRVRLFMLVGLLALPFGLLLTLASSVDHEVVLGRLAGSLILMVSVLASLGFLIWAREQLGEGTLAVFFGIGLLLGIDPDSNLFPSNPWKFGFSVGATVLVLGLAHLYRKRRLELGLAVALSAVSALTDARSTFAVMLMTASLVAWQLRPTARTRRGSTTRALLGGGAVVVGIYYLGQFLILRGLFGAATQARSQVQLQEAGSLIVGGRPELLATLRLMLDSPMGFGPGVMPNHHDITTAKMGMSTINYDPNNGYVENWMFGRGFSLHSMFGDLWAQFGVVGLAFTALLLVYLVRRMTVEVTAGTASAVLIYLACKTLWNMFFAPWPNSITHVELLLALLVARRRVPAPGAPLT